MPTYVHLHRQALSSWVFEDARRWHLFCYLLMKADEQGRAEVSINEYANRFGIPHTTCLRLLAEMEERGMIGLKADKKRTRITICKYVYYNTTPTETRTINGQTREEKEGERESNVSPTPLRNYVALRKRRKPQISLCSRSGTSEDYGYRRGGLPRSPLFPAVLGCLRLQARPSQRRARLAAAERCRPTCRLQRHSSIPSRLHCLPTTDDVRSAIPQPQAMGGRLHHRTAAQQPKLHLCNIPKTYSG